MESKLHGEHVSVSMGHVSICQRFPASHMACLLDEGEEVVHAPGQTIVHAGQTAAYVYIVTQGSARMRVDLTSSPVPVLAVLRLLRPGDIFGLVPVLDGRNYLAGLDAMIETRVLVAPRKAFLKELDRHPEAARQLIDELASTVRTYEGWLLSGA